MTDEIVSDFSPIGERDCPSGSHRPSVPAVALVGFMGAGKTTVGRALAARLGWRFADLDELIQSREGRRIEQIFQEQGEAGFRSLERSMMQELAGLSEEKPLVVALGGGAYPEETIREILQAARIAAVFLDASVEELFRRSDQPEVVRPLRQNQEQFRQLYEQRRPAYAKAQLRIETAGKKVAAIVEEIVLGLNLLRHQVWGADE